MKSHCALQLEGIYRDKCDNISITAEVPVSTEIDSLFANATLHAILLVGFVFQKYCDKTENMYNQLINRTK